MDRIEIYQEVKAMKLSYSFHFALYSVMLAIHIFILVQIFWLKKYFQLIFLVTSLIDALFLLYPIIPLIFMYRIILKKYLTKIFKIVSFCFILLSIFIGIILNMSFWINRAKTINFTRDCPFNFNQGKLNQLNSDIESNNFSSKKIKDLCNERKCFLDYSDFEEKFPYNFICNYNSSQEFKFQLEAKQRISPKGISYYSNNIILCEPKQFSELKAKVNNKINIFFEKCSQYLESIYICKRFEDYEHFDIEYDFSCPSTKYPSVQISLGVFCIIFDLIFAFIPWSFDYRSYKKTMGYIDEEIENNINNREENTAGVANETNATSNRNDGTENNQNSTSNERERVNNSQPQDTIIVAQENKSSNISKSAVNSMRSDIKSESKSYSKFSGSSSSNGAKCLIGHANNYKDRGIIKKLAKI